MMSNNCVKGVIYCRDVNTDPVGVVAAQKSQGGDKDFHVAQLMLAQHHIKQ